MDTSITIVIESSLISTMCIICSIEEAILYTLGGSFLDHTKHHPQTNVADLNKGAAVNCTIIAFYAYPRCPGYGIYFHYQGISPDFKVCITSMQIHLCPR